MESKAKVPPGMTARGAFRYALLAAICVLCTVTATAVAAPPTPAGTFDGSGTPAGSFGATELKVAVDEVSGDVYVLDAANDVVDRFTAGGTYVSQLRGADTTATTFGFASNGLLNDIAVDNSGGTYKGHVYVLARSSNTIYAYDESGTALYEAPGLAGRTCGLAVAPDGFLWAADRDSTDLVQLSPVDGTPTGTTFTVDKFDSCHIAFDNEGSIYAGGFSDGFDKYDGVNPAVSLDPSPNTTYAVATSFSRNDVFSGADDFIIPAPVIRQWDKSGAMVSEIRGTGGTSQFTGIAINGATDKLYVADFASSLVRMYDVPAQPPTATTSAASSIAKTTATLNGTVNPNGSDVTDCHFEYGTFASGRFDLQAPCVPAAPISGVRDTTVTADVTGLTPNTLYQYRLVTTNAGGTSTGDTVLFRTLALRLPVVVTGAADGITQTGATASGTVDPQGSATSCVVQYGTTASYGLEVATNDPGSGSGVVAVRASLAGLTASTLYHFRISCRNADGTANGSDATFRTLVPPPVVITDPPPVIPVIQDNDNRNVAAYKVCVKKAGKAYKKAKAKAKTAKKKKAAKKKKKKAIKKCANRFL